MPIPAKSLVLCDLGLRPFSVLHKTEACGSPAWDGVVLTTPTLPEHCGPHRGLDSFSGKPRGSGPPAGSALPIEGVILSLQDLIGYFEPPSEELQHEEKQTKLRSLRNRQSLFQEEVKPGVEGGTRGGGVWPGLWGGEELYNSQCQGFKEGRGLGRSSREGGTCRIVMSWTSRINLC